MTIARWVAGGVHTMLCFDPTRGIDIGTKRQIYVLLRDLAEAGAAILLYTSELKEVELVCDRAMVIFGGKVVREISGVDADEPATPARRLQPATGLRAARRGRRGVVAQAEKAPDGAVARRWPDGGGGHPRTAPSEAER